MKLRLPILLLLFTICLSFFSPLFFNGRLPIPSDTIIGLYHPFRDLYAKNYPNGIPYKNFLITDPVRQQIPWRSLSVDLLKRGQMPLWNPYSFSGTPLLGNVQSAVFYPLNILLLILPFSIGWSVQVFLQPLLAGLFLYLYLRGLKVLRTGAILGSVSFMFCGFSVAWMEWNTVLHTGLWLPLVLLAIDRIVLPNDENKKAFFTDEKILWGIVFIFSLSASLFAGHLQTFFYVIIFSLLYLLIRLLKEKPVLKVVFGFFVSYIFFLIITAVQWITSFQFILQSARDIDLNWKVEGWFMPWQHLIQFLVPDFFGNPTTLNYWGVWNYAEFAGYISVIPMILAVYALLFRRDKKTYVFAAAFVISMLFILQTPVAESVFIWQIPFLSTAQPTRLLFLTDFSLAILAALGFDLLVKKRKYIIYPILLFTILYGIIWTSVSVGGTNFFEATPENIATAKRNLYLPTIVFIVGSILLFILSKLKSQRLQYGVIALLIFLTLFDFFRFFTKFTPFTERAYLFPETKALSFLQKQPGQFRIMETDSRILPPNFSSFYKLQSIDGYDPLYLRRYAELIAASERGEANIAPPFGFNRIITPQNHASKIIDLLGVKYVLSLQDITSPKLKKVFQEGETRVYENSQVLPRVFFVKRTTYAKDKQAAINRMMESSFNPSEEAVIEYDKRSGGPDLDQGWTAGEAKIIRYSENEIVIETNISHPDEQAEGFLVLMDTYYPTWRAVLSRGDTVLETENIIYLTNYNFRGIVIPHGKHTVTFSNAMIHKLEL